MATHTLNQQPDGDPSKVHLVMITGADNRANMLSMILPRLKGWFDSITVTDTGSTDRTMAVCDVNGVDRLENLFTGPLPLCHVPALDLIPTNEWVYLCDSDECPTYTLLQLQRWLVERGNRFGIHKWSFPCLGHWFDENDVLVGDSCMDPIKGDWQHIIHPDRTFRNTRLVKKLPGFRIEYNGSHYCFNVDGEEMYYPAPWNHYKGNKSRAKSQFIHGLSHPDEHDFTGQQAEEWKALKKALGVRMKDIALWSANKSAPDECMEMWKGWNKGDWGVAHGVFNHVYKYNWNGEEPECYEHCCLYP